jgi:hypothetical protein
MATLTSGGIRFASLPVVDELNSKRGIFPTGTAWVFYQASAPTGWTKNTSLTVNDKALRVVSGVTGGSSGGTNGFSVIMGGFNVGGGSLTSSNATGGTQLSEPQIVSHTHPNSGTGLDAVPAIFNPDGAFTGWNGGDVARSSGWTRTSPGFGAAGTAPVGDAHSHPFSGTAPVPAQSVSMDPTYVDIIVCTFDG